MRTLDARTGEELWRSDTVRGPLVPDGERVLGVATQPTDLDRSEIVALDPADGTELWRGPLRGRSELGSHLKVLMAFRWDYDESGSGEGYGERVAALG